MAQLSAIIVTTVLLLFFGLFIRFFFGGWTPNKILQGIDKALSKSQFRQVSLLLFLPFLPLRYSFLSMPYSIRLITADSTSGSGVV